MGEQLTRTALVLGAATGGALLAGWLSSQLLRWSARQRRYRQFLLRLRESCHRPWVALLVCWANLSVLSATRLTGGVANVIRHGLQLALIGSAGWLSVTVLFVAEDAVLQWLRIDVPDNRRARRARTQVAILRRLTAAIVILLTLATMFMTFAPLRTLGTSLLASAGVAGALIGLAAQSTLTNVFAGLQLALSDTLRFDDVVVVEDEWGRVEELTLTYVVLHLWDERRLVLPTTYFTKTPFQNWTRRESRVLGAVLLHLDYRAPVDELRAEAGRLVEASPLWDQRDWVLQVVDSTPWTMVVRVLASAADAPSSWDLRCELREKLIGFLKVHYPECLPCPAVPLAEWPDGGARARRATPGK
jgi:small-conductance mechanosensitive channel